MDATPLRNLLFGATLFAASLAAAATAPAARFTSVVRISAAPARWVAAGGGLLAFGTGDDHVTFVLEENPFGPRTHFVAPSPISGAILFGRHGYLIVEGEGLWAIHLEDPSAPELGGFLALPEASAVCDWSAQRFLFAGSGPLYSVLLGAPHICCLDDNGNCGTGGEEFPPISLDEQPYLSVPRGVTAMVRSGDRLLLAYTGRGVFRIPSRFVPPGIFLRPWMALPGEVKGMATVGDLVVAAAGPQGLLVLAPGAPGDPGTLVASLPVDAGSLVSEGRRIYVAGSQGLYTALVESPQAVTWNVTVSPAASLSFVPDLVSLTQGDSVKWVWTSGSHTTTSGSAACLSNGLWSSAINPTTTSFTRVFNDAAGAYPYFCIPHCSLYQMVGQVNVAAATAANSTPYSVTPNRMTSANQGTDATVTWDATNCASTGYHILYGFGSKLASAMGAAPVAGDIAGAKCAIGTTGTYPWTAVPDPSGDASRFLWYLVVGDNGTTTEGSWGLTSAPAQRGGTTACGFCTITTKSTAAVCGTP